MNEQNNSFLDKAWKEREEGIYKSIFKNIPQQIYTPQDPNKVAIGGDLLVLLSWGVFEIPPSDEKPYWMYLTSGLSNPLGEEKEELSGAGFELCIRVPEKSNWAINLFFNLMGYVIETGNFFAKGGTLPLNSPINASNPKCQLNSILFWSPVDLPNSFQLQSGKFDLIEAIGITQDEYQFAKDSSSNALFQALTKKLSNPLTDTMRSSCL